MKIGDICNRVFISITEDEPVRRAAELMRRHHVGTLVVTRFDNENTVPIGIVTDRDIVIEVIAEGVDPDDITVGDIMSDMVILACEDDGVSDTLEIMRKHRIRRIPVVNKRDALVGVLALDDLLQLIAANLDDMAAIVGGQRLQETQARA